METWPFLDGEMARSQCGEACGRKGDIIVTTNAIYHMLISNNVYEVPDSRHALGER